MASGYNYTPPGKNFLNDVAHLVILAVLLIVLLIIVTKFKIVHPSAVPGWQGVYCNYIEQKHSQIAIITSNTGDGNAQSLYTLLSNERPDLRFQLVKTRDLSPQLLTRYELVVLEQARDVSFKAIDSITAYLDKGGSLVWTGNSLSNQQPDSQDITEAKRRNETEKNFSSKYNGKWESYYDYYMDASRREGFGEFGENFIGSYLKTESMQKPSLKIILDDHMLVSGLVKDLPLKEGAKVTEVNPGSGLALIANIPTNKEDEEIPAIIEQKYVGKILYLAVPLSSIESKTFRQNLFDYLVTC